MELVDFLAIICIIYLIKNIVIYLNYKKALLLTNDYALKTIDENKQKEFLNILNEYKDFCKDLLNPFKWTFNQQFKNLESKLKEKHKELERIKNGA